MPTKAACRTDWCTSESSLILRKKLPLDSGFFGRVCNCELVVCQSSIFGSGIGVRSQLPPAPLWVLCTMDS